MMEKITYSFQITIDDSNGFNSSFLKFFQNFVLFEVLLLSQILKIPTEEEQCQRFVGSIS